MLQLGSSPLVNCSRSSERAARVAASTTHTHSLRLMFASPHAVPHPHSTEREKERRCYRNGENEPFFAEPDFGRYEELFDGSVDLDFFCCGLSKGGREWGPYCCALANEE